MAASIEANLNEAQARRLENVYGQLATLLRQADIVARLRDASGDNEWSALQIVGHVVEIIPYWLNQCRALIAAAEPPKFGRALDAPERLAAVERGARGNPDELLRLLDEEVRAAAKAIRRLSTADRHKKGVHVRVGEMTVADIVERLIVAHAEDHLLQVRGALGISKSS